MGQHQRHLRRSQRRAVRDHHQSDEKLNPGFKRGIYIGSLKDKAVTMFIPAIALGDKTSARKYVKGAAD